MNNLNRSLYRTLRRAITIAVLLSGAVSVEAQVRGVGAGSFVLDDNSGSGKTVTLWAPSITSTYSLELPPSLGSMGQTLVINGTGQLVWGSGGVGSFSGGTTGLLPNTPTSGDVVLSGILNPANGGTGQTSLTPYALLAGGTTATGAMQQVSGVGTSGQVLTSNGSGTLPTWQNNAATVTNNTSTSSINTEQDNYTIQPTSNLIRITNMSNQTELITGINSAGVADGRQISIENVSSFPIEIVNENAGSMSANQFELPGAQPIIIGQLGVATFIYNATNQKWDLLATND